MRCCNFASRAFTRVDQLLMWCLTPGGQVGSIESKKWPSRMNHKWWTIFWEFSTECSQRYADREQGLAFKTKYRNLAARRRDLMQAGTWTQRSTAIDGRLLSLRLLHSSLVRSIVCIIGIAIHAAGKPAYSPVARYILRFGHEATRAVSQPS